MSHLCECTHRLVPTGCSVPRGEPRLSAWLIFGSSDRAEAAQCARSHTVGFVFDLTLLLRHLTTVPSHLAHWRLTRMIKSQSSVRWEQAAREGDQWLKSPQTSFLVSSYHYRRRTDENPSYSSSVNNSLSPSLLFPHLSHSLLYYHSDIKRSQPADSRSILVPPRPSTADAPASVPI